METEVDWDKMKTEGKMNTGDQELNPSLKMSLGIGALEVSGGSNANSGEEISMATLEVGPPLRQPLTNTVTLNKFNGDTATYL